MSKIRLDVKKVKEAREYAKRIALNTQRFVEEHSTVAVERTVLRLLGVDGINEEGVPLPNLVVDHLKEKHALEDGAAFHIGNAMVMLKKTPQEIAEEVAAGNLDLTKIPVADAFERNLAVEEVAKKMVEKI